MKRAKVIIGANFGDEGKGLMTDYFASKGNSLVVRFNGGAQAGHTVVTEGKRHVFNHFGSGTLVGAPTYLSKFFVVNPIIFFREYQQLKELGITPTVYVDEQCRVSTPYDMLINQIAEVSRGEEKHGSCGIGFHETIVRNNTCPLTAIDLWDEKFVRQCLKMIKNNYVSNRLKYLKIKEVDDYFTQFLTSEDVIERYLQDIQFFNKNINGYSDAILGTETRNKNIIFEGAQGLLLDADHPFFPHVTCSKTGIHNVCFLTRWFDIDYLDIVYVTRTYLTRHGAGPLPNEIFELPYSKVKDDTNVRNAHQGELRFGWLDLDRLERFIEQDFSVGNVSGRSFSVAITCLDQVDNDVVFVKDGRLHKKDPKDFVNLISSVEYLSFGETRETVSIYEE